MGHKNVNDTRHISYEYLCPYANSEYQNPFHQYKEANLFEISLSLFPTENIKRYYRIIENVGINVHKTYISIICLFSRKLAHTVNLENVFPF